MNVDKNRLIEAQYTLYAVTEDNKEELIEQTTPERPLAYIHGMGIMLEAFERNLLGLAPGDSFDFYLQPAEAYGEHQPNYVMMLDKEMFFIDGKFNDEVVKVGNIVPMITNDGQQLQGLVLEVTPDQVKMDFNHPLANRTLHFVGSVQEVSEATPEDIAEFLGTPGGGCCGCHGADEGGCCGCH